MKLKITEKLSVLLGIYIEIILNDISGQFNHSFQTGIFLSAMKQTVNVQDISFFSIHMK